MHFFQTLPRRRVASALGYLGDLLTCGRVVPELTQATLQRLLIARLLSACLLDAGSRIWLGRWTIIGAASLHLPCRGRGNNE
jgi:hypothetical protein